MIISLKIQGTTQANSMRQVLHGFNHAKTIQQEQNVKKLARNTDNVYDVMNTDQHNDIKMPPSEKGQFD